LLKTKKDEPAVTPLKRPLTGSVTVLTPSEIPLLREHLLRLDPESRRQRFNGAISERFVERYNSNYITDGTVVIGYFVAGEMRGVAELHPPDQHGSSPEIAFSVEKLVRSQGVGSILFEKVIHEARIKGYDSLQMTTVHNNERMKALARKFGVRMEFRKGESTGILKLKQRVSTRIQPHMDSHSTSAA
jgi:GNAT superfamily N-acetyltransferase